MRGRSSLASLSASVRRELQRRLKTALALGWIRTHPRRANRIRAEGAWLLGGAVGKSYGDNSAALHQYLRQNHPDLPVYWVIGRQSPDVAIAQSQGPVLYHDDVQTYVRSFLAAVHVISHGVQDVPGCSSSLSSKAVKVRLGHGLTALKKTKPRLGQTNESANAVFDLVPVCSEFERGHKLEWGIDPSRLVITGIPRFDTLLAKQNAYPTDPLRILYMPTWRDSLASTADREASSFVEGFDGFLSNPLLHSLLNRYGATLDVFLHMNLAPYIRGLEQRLKGTPVRHIEMTDPQRLFAEVGLLITDYSSVAWDMLYIDKPVVFYHIDLEDHERHRGGYLTRDSGWPGPVATEPAELIEILACYLVGKMQANPCQEQRMSDWQQTAFAFRDDRNAERVTGAILRTLQRCGSLRGLECPE